MLTRTIGALQPDLFARTDDPAALETAGIQTTRVLYRCRPCEQRTGHARLWRETFRVHGHLWTAIDGTTHRGFEPPVASCRGCQRPTRGATIRGQFSAAHRCDARCIYAKGPDCECSCGGANHGAGHGR
jgi:hypothetical protein